MELARILLRVEGGQHRVDEDFLLRHGIVEPHLPRTAAIPFADAGIVGEIAMIRGHGGVSGMDGRNPLLPAAGQVVIVDPMFFPMGAVVEAFAIGSPVLVRGVVGHGRHNATFVIGFNQQQPGIDAVNILDAVFDVSSVGPPGFVRTQGQPVVHGVDLPVVHADRLLSPFLELPGLDIQHSLDEPVIHPGIHERLAAVRCQGDMGCQTANTFPFRFELLGNITQSYPLAWRGTQVHLVKTARLEPVEDSGAGVKKGVAADDLQGQNLVAEKIDQREGLRVAPFAAGEVKDDETAVFRHRFLGEIEALLILGDPGLEDVGHNARLGLDEFAKQLRGFGGLEHGRAMFRSTARQRK